MTSSLLTLRDVQERDALLDSILSSDSIGELCRMGRKVYYAFDGSFYAEGRSRHEVAEKLLRFAERE